MIELLIVVAIIAILAAIAVPNFLEAQLRAKVSRVRTDMRSLATALEAYFVDWNHYPYFDGYGLPGRYNEIIYRLISLTTPVAYMTSVDFRDPFLAGGSNAYQDGLTRYYYNYRNHEFFIVTAPTGEPFVVPVWVLNSIGPDMVPNQGLQAEVWARGFPSPLVVYDPTNGTVSAGDMPRTGGATQFKSYQ